MSVKVTYIGAHDGVETPYGTAIRGGDPIDVPKDTADELVDRGDFARSHTKAAQETPAADVPQEN